MLDQQTLREKIVVFLKEDGIERVTTRNFEKKLAKLAPTNEKLVYEAFLALEHPRSMKAVGYEYVQPVEVHFDQRVDFLTVMSTYLSEHPETKKIIESGCATGIDTSYLASTFPERQFKGFDIDNQMLRKAKERRKRLGLTKNLWFYQGDYAKVNGKESKSCDVLFNNASLMSYTPLEKLETVITTLSERVVSGGVLILSGLNDKGVENILKNIDPKSRIHPEPLQKTHYHTLDGDNYYFLVFQVK